MYVRSCRRLNGKGDAKPVRRCSSLFEVRPCLWRRRIPVADIRPRCDVQHGSRVSDGARKYVLCNKPGKDLAEIRAKGVPPTSRLESDCPTRRSRNPNRSSGIIAMRHGRHSRRHHRSGPAARTARGPRRVPWVVRRPSVARLGRRADGELWQVGLGDRDEPARLEPLHQLRVPVRHEPLQEAGTRRVLHTRILRKEVLQQERHSRQWPIADVALRQLAGMVVHLDRHAVQRRIDPLDAVDHLIHQFQRRDLFAANQLRQTNRVVLRKLFHVVHSKGCVFGPTAWYSRALALSNIDCLYVELPKELDASGRYALHSDSRERTTTTCAFSIQPSSGMRGRTK